MASITNITNKSQIIQCVEMYAKRIPEIDIEYSIKVFVQAIRQKHFVKICIENQNVIAWISATEGLLAYRNERVLKAEHYCSNEIGFKAARLVLDMHSTLIDEAERLDIKYIYAMCSPADEKFILTKILEKDGWQRQGYQAIWKIT